MPRSSFSAALRFLLIGLALLLGTVAAWAQAAPAAPHGYDFMTVIAEFSPIDPVSKVYFIPAFQGKSEIALESSIRYASEYGLNSTKRQAAYNQSIRKNTELVNQQLSLLTVAGWELVHVWETGRAESTRYLFRKPRP